MGLEDVEFCEQGCCTGDDDHESKDSMDRLIPGGEMWYKDWDERKAIIV